MPKYKIFEEENITKELLNQIKVGDLVKINNWKRPLRVMAVSGNFFIMSLKAFYGQAIYSICEKNKIGGYFYCAPDNCYTAYNYGEKTECEQAIKDLEAGVLELSRRRMLRIKTIAIKEE